MKMDLQAICTEKDHFTVTDLQGMTANIQLPFPFLLFFYKTKVCWWKTYFKHPLCSLWRVTNVNSSSTYQLLHHISSSCTLKQLGQKSDFLYFSTAIAGKILVTAKCSITRNAAPPPGTETPVKGTVTMFQLVRCSAFIGIFIFSERSILFLKSFQSSTSLANSCHGRIGNAGRPAC